MQKSQTSPQIVSHRVVKRGLSILLSSACLIALSLAQTSVARAQVECLGQCEEELTLCIGHSGHIPMLEVICQDSYEACVDACLGSEAAVLI